MILAHIFNTIWLFLIKLGSYGTEWYRHSWHILIRSRWPTFYGQVILRYIFKVIFTVQWFWIISSRLFTIFWSNMVQWYRIMQTITAYNNLVTVTYFLLFIDFGSYLQAYWTVFDQNWFIGTEWYTQSWPMLIQSWWLIFMVQWFSFISSKLLVILP